MSAPPVVGRLAPSPTGRLHVGHARSFLAAWWSARSRGGRVVLRIEDLDTQRSRPEHVAGVLEDLRWLGLDWDGEPFVQSEHTDTLERALLQLVLRSLAYPCVCSRKDQRSALGAPHAAEEAGESAAELRYPGTCRDRYGSLRHAETLRRQTAGLRFRVPPGAVRTADALAGTCVEDVSATVGDFLLARRDGAVAYQLAVVVHDAEQGVSEVVRGDDLLASTPRQWLLQEALGLPHPCWLHLPLVVDASGERLAKRSGGLTLASLRERGADPRRLVAWAARSLGMETPATVTPAAAAQAFDRARIPRSPVRFTSSDERDLLA
jgi:glutamyl-tRNA synthetase